MNFQWSEFAKAARLEKTENIPVAFIAAGPWLPGFLGINTLDFYTFPDEFFRAHLSLLGRFPDALWLPGFWVEFGTAAETSVFGAKVRFHADRPPTVFPLSCTTDELALAPMPDPYLDGLLAITLRRYLKLETRLKADGLGVHMVASRGPLAIAAKLIGLHRFLNLLQQNDRGLLIFLDHLSKFVVLWLRTQIEQINEPLGIMILDDIVGLVSLDLYRKHIATLMEKTFLPFKGLVRVFHNDTPCEHLLPLLANSHFEVFNFSHDIPMTVAKETMGHQVALMGNIHQSEVAVKGTPVDVMLAARECVKDGSEGGGLILSVSGALYPGTPAKNIDAIIKTSQG